MIHHNYHDHANDVEEQVLATPNLAKGSFLQKRAIGASYHSVPRFPEKLHDILSHQIEQDGLDHIISWQPHGRCFVIHKPDEFKTQILPRYFDKCTKISSFQRQLSLYGFTRLTKGADKGGYYHEMFLRGKPFLAHQITRTTVKGTGVRARSNPEEEPNLWKMSWVGVPGNKRGNKTINDMRSGIMTTLVSSAMMQPSSTWHSNNVRNTSTPPLVTPVVERNMLALPISSDPADQRVVSGVMVPTSFQGQGMDDDIMTFGGKSFHVLDVNGATMNKPNEHPFAIPSKNDDLDSMMAQIVEDDLVNNYDPSTEDDKSEADFIRMIEEVLRQS